MAKEPSLVRASDIGAWAYCHRAWWLAQVKGIPHRNPATLQRGNAVHAAHGQAVVQAVRLRRAGLLFVGAAIFLLALVVVVWLAYL